MLPLPLMIALIVAFGVDPPRAGIPAPDVGFRLLETCQSSAAAGEAKRYAVTPQRVPGPASASGEDVDELSARLVSLRRSARRRRGRSRAGLRPRLARRRYRSRDSGDRRCRANRARLQEIKVNRGQRELGR